MIPFPSPLHPAIVHFPIVLILVGAMGSVAAVFLRRWCLPWLAAGLLAGGAIGTYFAVWSGGQEEEMVGELSPQAENVLDQHEEWGKRTRTLAVFAAVLATLCAATSRFPRTSRGLSVVAALLALAAAYSVAKTGHYGGQLVYEHGAGINMAAGAATQDLPPAKDDD